MLNSQSDNNPLPLGRATKPFDIFGFVQRYGLTAIVLGAFLFTMLVPGVILLSKPNYEVRSVLKIDPVVPSLITKSEDPSIINYFHDYARTQVQRITDYSLLEMAIKELPPEQRHAMFPPSLDLQKCTAILQILLKVKPISRTHLLELSLAGPRPEGLAPLLNSVMKVFLEKVREETAEQNSGRLTYLKSKREELEKDIAGLEDQLHTLAEKIHTVSFSEEFNVMQQKVQQLQKLSVQVLGDRIMAEEKYKEGKKKLQALSSLSLDANVDDMVMKDQSLDFTSSWTYQELQKMRASIDGITRKNKDRMYIERRMKAMREYEEKLRKEVRDSAKNILQGKRTYELSREAIIDKSEFEAANKSEDALRATLKQTQKESDRITAGMLQGSALEKELEHSRNLLFRIDTRIHELAAESKAPLRMTIDSKARTPHTATGSNTKKLLAICILLSFGSAGAAFLACDVLDNRIHGPRNIQQALGYPPIWPISRLDERIPFHSLYKHAHNIQSAMAIRSLAVRLYREKQENNSQIFLFTGVDRECGTSSIVLNCAQVLATMVPKIIVVDGNAHHPHLPALAAGSLRPPNGMSDMFVSNNQTPPEIIRDEERNISILPFGRQGKENGLPQFMLKPLMDVLKKHYDIICIDTDAILQSDLTEYFAINADAVILISQGDRSLYKNLRRAAEILVRLNVPAIAPVLNWGGKHRTTFVDDILERLPARITGKKSRQTPPSPSPATKESP